MSLIIINALNIFIRMMPQQKEKQPSESQLQKIESVLSYQLRRLVQLWLSNSVNDNYQTIVMNYLDQFQSKDLQLRQIKKQIELTLKKQSPYFMIRHLLQQKQQLLNSLEKEIQDLDHYCSLNNEEEPELESVSKVLNDLRQSHMLIVQSIMQLLQRYKIKQKTNIQIRTDYVEIIANFSEESSFIKNSVLKYYIPFSAQFDPLLVEQARVLKKKYKQNSIVYNKNIQKLLTLPPSYMYRLLRAKKNMEDLISTRNSKVVEQMNERQFDENSVKSQDQISEEQEKVQDKQQPSKQHKKKATFQEKEKQQQRQRQEEKQSQKAPQRKKIVLNFTLDNSAYVSERKKVKSRANTRSETINFYEQKYNMVNQEPKQSQRNKTLQSYQHLKREERSRNRAQIEINKFQLANQKEKQLKRLKISPPVLKIDIKSQIRHRKESIHTKRSNLPLKKQLQGSFSPKDVRIFKDEATQHQQMEAFIQNKRFYLLQLQKDSKILLESSYPAINNKKRSNKINQTPLKQKVQQRNHFEFSNSCRRQPQLKAASKKHKNYNSGELEFSGIQQHELNELQYKATHKNFIPRGLKNKNYLNSNQRLDQGEFEEKRWEREKEQLEQQSLRERQKQIVAKINRKYKLLALKQKQYQLSKLGHVIYHRMREKQENSSRYKLHRKKKQFIS